MRPVLTRAEIEGQRKLARLSQSRRAKYGPPPEDPAVWWKQIETVAAELGVAITWGELQRRTPDDDESSVASESGQR